MLLYLDTSLLVSAMTHEVMTEKTQRWIEKHEADDLVISWWVQTEFSFALSMKVRTGAINNTKRNEVISTFTEKVLPSLKVVPVYKRHFRTAEDWAGQTTLNLRAGDALHLAISKDIKAVLCTLDNKLTQAASVVGVETLSP